MIDIEELERLAKAAQTDIPGHRIKFFMQMDPETVLALITEMRTLREDLQATKLLAHANAEMFKAERVDGERYRWLRQQHWNESTLFVVAGHHSVLRLGTDCPSDERLDAAIDAARSKEKA